MSTRWEERTRKTQNAVLEILKDTVDVLERNNLRYIAYFGTLLGAMRHQGYIPWDDDVDLLMPRSDYEKLKTIFAKEFDKKYFLQDVYTDSEYPSMIAKIRNSETTFIERGYVKCKKMNQGMFVDIFIAEDYLENNRNRKRLGKLRVWESVLTSKVAVNSSRGRRLISKLFSRKAIIKRIEKHTNKISIGKDNKVVVQSRYILDEGIFSETILTPFESVSIRVPKQFDESLTKIYGDWRKLPPEEDRIPKHSTQHVRTDMPYYEYIRSELNKK